uniref:Uncharacterized protein n=1 Tax=viral metagenome TaxID=1070528 RepID=A0A6C0CHJ5_9ZZZZ
MIVVICLLFIFLIIDYIIIKKYKKYEITKQINEIIEIIKISENDINKINHMIDLLTINNKRQDILKKIINVLIKNKQKELKSIMFTNIKQESEIVSNVVKKHLRTYKNNLHEYKIYLRNFIKSLNESKEVSIIISQV